MNSFFDEEAKTKFHRSNVEMDSLIATKVKNRVAKFEIRSGYRRKSLTYLSSTLTFMRVFGLSFVNVLPVPMKFMYVFEIFTIAKPGTKM